MARFGQLWPAQSPRVDALSPGLGRQIRGLKLPSTCKRESHSMLPAYATTSALHKDGGRWSSHVSAPRRAIEPSIWLKMPDLCDWTDHYRSIVTGLSEVRPKEALCTAESDQKPHLLQGASNSCPVSQSPSLLARSHKSRFANGTKLTEASRDEQHSSDSMSSSSSQIPGPIAVSSILASHRCRRLCTFLVLLLDSDAVKGRMALLNPKMRGRTGIGPFASRKVLSSVRRWHEARGGRDGDAA